MTALHKYWYFQFIKSSQKPFTLPYRNRNLVKKMQNKTCEAVFENGVFRLLKPSDFAVSEGQRVRITIEPVESPEDVLELVTSVYNGLSEDQIDEIERVILSRENFFKDRNF